MALVRGEVCVRGNYPQQLTCEYVATQNDSNMNNIINASIFKCTLVYEGGGEKKRFGWWSDVFIGMTSAVELFLKKFVHLHYR